MNNGFVKVGAVSPAIRVADVSANCDECIKEAVRGANLGLKILVFPELVLTGATAEDLYFQRTLTVAAERELERFMESTVSLDIVCVVGLPLLVGGKIYNAAAVVSRGVLLGVVAKSALSPSERRFFAKAPEENIEISFAGYDTLLGGNLLFACECVSSLTFAVAIGADASTPLARSRSHAVCGATLIVNPTANPEIVCSYEREKRRILADSDSLICAIVTASAGEGESGTDAIYSGRCYVAECGYMLSESLPFAEDSLAYSECDFDAILGDRIKQPEFESCEALDYDYISFELDFCETELTRKTDKLPFVPSEKTELASRCELILDIQSRSLANRVARSYSTGVTVGVSGGLDSTLALLVAVRAMKILGKEPSSVTAVTMPCFGTTSRTKGNAEKLSESLGATLKCIDIKAAVSQHFKDIGHAEDDFSVVYENAQARERTQLLMDIANSSGSLVVGTGDLSELALGWATYNGDHMSMYGVNGGIPKTLMRYIVSYCADLYEGEGQTVISDVLRDILATPVSPELLPPKDGEIAQCTEGIVGPYELHDFFLYYTVRHGFSPDKILRLAEYAFDGEYTGEIIEGWLRVFVKRFFAQQFKRSCLPDGPKVGSVTLSPRGGYKMPSDAVSSEWIRKLEE